MFITIQKLSDKIRKRNIELPRAKETLSGRKFDNDKAGIKLHPLRYELNNRQRGGSKKRRLLMV